MSEPILTPAAQATLLLCAQLKQSADAQPFTTGEYHKLVRRLGEHGYGVSDLLDGAQWSALSATMGEVLWDGARIEQLLSRGPALALAQDCWAQSGLWVMSVADADYPEPWRWRLGTQAPPLIFGVGAPRLARRDGYAIVGSRNADVASLEFAARLAERCARQELAVISGGAKGIDNTAMTAAIEAGGWATGILSEGLARAGVAANNREALERRSLLLLSPYSPDAPFHVGAAMGRNRLIYALAQASFVIASDARSGGTWAGAVETLKSKWSPLFVRAGAATPPGNALLISQGATRFPESDLTVDLELRSWCAAHSVAEKVDGGGQTHLPL